jgi:hypothetical protein
VPDTASLRDRDAATAEVLARFGEENLTVVLEVYRRFRDKVDVRKLMDWSIKEPLDKLLQPVFLAAAVVITEDLGLAELTELLRAAQEQARELEPQPEPTELAGSLASTARDLDGHIERRAQQIAGPRIAAAEQEYHARATRLRREHRQQIQRRDDLITELHRQLRAQVRQVERLHPDNKRLRTALRRAQKVPVRIEGGVTVMLAADVYAAIELEETPK